jgi:hypothetical protein
LTLAFGIGGGMTILVTLKERLSGCIHPDRRKQE